MGISLKGFDVFPEVVDLTKQLFLGVLGHLFLGHVDDNPVADAAEDSPDRMDGTYS